MHHEEKKENRFSSKKAWGLVSTPFKTILKMPGKLADATMNVFSSKDHDTHAPGKEHEGHLEPPTEHKRSLVSKAFKSIGKLNPFSKGHTTKHEEKA